MFGTPSDHWSIFHYQKWSYQEKLERNYACASVETCYGYLFFWTYQRRHDIRRFDCYSI